MQGFDTLRKFVLYLCVRVCEVVFRFGDVAHACSGVCFRVRVSLRVCIDWSCELKFTCVSSRLNMFLFMVVVTVTVMVMFMLMFSVCACLCQRSQLEMVLVAFIGDSKKRRTSAKVCSRRTSVVSHW